MNKDQVEGKGKQVEGKIKEAVGKAVGNDRLQVKGKLKPEDALLSLRTDPPRVPLQAHRRLVTDERLFSYP